MNKLFAFINRHPAITLMILAPVFNELVTGTSSPLEFIQPVHLIMSVLPTGIAALLCRELLIRWKSDWKGLIVIAAAFAIFRTIIVERIIFDPEFIIEISKDKTDFIWNIFWSPLTSMMHFTGLIGTIISIKFTELLAPEKKNELWLKPAALSLCIGSIAAWLVSSWIWIPVKVPVLQIVIFSGLFVCLIFLTWIFKRPQEKTTKEPTIRGAANAALGVFASLVPYFFIGTFISGPLNLVCIIVWNILVILMLYFVNNKFQNTAPLSKLYFMGGALVFHALFNGAIDLYNFEGRIIVSGLLFIFLHAVKVKLIDDAKLSA